MSEDASRACIHFDALFTLRDAGMTDEAHASRRCLHTTSLVREVGALTGVYGGVAICGDQNLCVPYDPTATNPDVIIAGIRALLPALIKESPMLFFARQNDALTMQVASCPVHGSVTV